MKFDEAGTYKLEYTATDGCGNSTTEDRLVTVTPPPYYSAIWDGSSNSAWTRADLAADFPDPQPAVANGTGSSPFDDIMPWSGMQIVEDAEAGTLVSIPKYWYKWTRDGESMKLSIANEPQDGFFVSPAHADRGDGVGERDVVYIGRYHCANGANGYKSLTNVAPLAYDTRNYIRTKFNSIAPDVWQQDFAMFWTIRMLFLVEFASWNKGVIGEGGHLPGDGTKANTGTTDSMQYHTGTTATSRNSLGYVQYRHIENLWGNLFEWVDGIYFNNDNVYVINNPSEFSDTANGTLVGTRAISSNFVKGFTNPTVQGYEFALFPNRVSGTGISFLYSSNNGACLYTGYGYASQNSIYGLFFLDATIPADATDRDCPRDIGWRLMKLPNN